MNSFLRSLDPVSQVILFGPGELLGFIVLGVDWGLSALAVKRLVERVLVVDELMTIGVVVQVGSSFRFLDGDVHVKATLASEQDAFR